MSSEVDSQHSRVTQANTELNEGLKSCRTLVENYRVMLTGEQAPPSDNDNQETETPQNSEL